MTAEQVRASLALRWPDSEYLSIYEAPEQSSRGGRKLDVLVVSLWPSRGLQLDGVEVKVSSSDWTRELKNGAKSDFWWRHTNRFWLAVPTHLAEKAQASLPPTWGLLSCPLEGAPKVAVKPEERKAEPLSWQTTVGLLRAAADAGVNALRRAEQRGYAQGRQAGIEFAESRSPDGAAKNALEDLRKRVAAFEQASGLSISRTWDVERLGELVALIQKECLDPGWLVRNVGATTKHLEELALGLVETARRAGSIAAKLSAAVAAADKQAA